jgi:hypothetical protein
MRAASSSKNRQRGFVSAVGVSTVLSHEAARGMLAETDAERSTHRSSVIAFGLACASFEIDRVERLADRGKCDPVSTTRLEAVESVVDWATRFAAAERDRVCSIGSIDPIEIVRAASMVDLARAVVDADRAIRDAKLYRDGFVRIGHRPIALSIAAEQLEVVNEAHATVAGNLTTFDGAASALRWYLTPAGLPESLGELSRVAEARSAALANAGCDR